MCGVAGIVDFSGRPIQGLHTRMLADALAHRGPDDEGFYSHVGSRSAVAFAHKRLSIVDLSSAGRQPMFNEDGTLALIANCEIYNHVELRNRLKDRHRFVSHCDAEVILHLFEELGTDCFEQLDGMFACALWDTREQRLVLVRDRFGKKPLYYVETSGRLVFASELPALLRLPETPRGVASDRLGEYLTLGFVRSPQTLVKGVNRLPAGALLVATPDRPAEVSRYWDLPEVNESAAEPEEAEREIEQLLERAVRKRLMADVPVGAFLSGGLDSSVIVALMGRLQGEPVRTFSMGFSDRPDLSELPAAAAISRAVGSVHEQILLAPPDPTAVEVVLRSYGEPFADSTALAVSVLAAAARRSGCPVVLTGDGGDELFAGYRRFDAALRRAQPLPRALTRVLSRPFQGRFKRAITRWGRTTIERFIAASAVVDPDYTACLLREPSTFNAEVLTAQYEDRITRRPDLTGLRALLALNLETYLADDLLPKTDLMTMAHGVEARCPFLDSELFCYVWNLPDRQKLHGGVGKQIARRLATRLLGHGVATKPKQGFSIPVDAWMRGPWRLMVTDSLLGPSPLSEWIDQNAIRAIWEKHLRGADWSGPLWSLLVLERWLRRLSYRPPGD